MLGSKKAHPLVPRCHNSTVRIEVLEESRLQDGIGAQILRTLSVLAFSKQHNLPVQIPRFTHFMDRPADQIGIKHSVEEILEWMNDLVGLAANCTDTSDNFESDSPTLKIKVDRNSFIYWFLKRHPKGLVFFIKVFEIFVKRRKIRIELEDAFFAVDDNPDSLRELGLNTFIDQTSKNKLFTIGVHIRRGDALFSQNPRPQIPDALVLSDLSQRYLPEEYYVSVVENIIEKLGIEDFVIEIFTDSSDVPQIYRPASDHEYWKSFKDQFGNMYYEPVRFELFKSRFPSVKIQNSLSSIECIEKLAVVDVLVMSKSSFSFLAALLNSNGLVVYHDFWHPPLKEWIRADIKGSIQDNPSSHYSEPQDRS
jgi:hypothetical protein